MDAWVVYVEAGNASVAEKAARAVDDLDPRPHPVIVLDPSEHLVLILERSAVVGLRAAALMGREAGLDVGAVPESCEDWLAARARSS